jgi:hypothetical protein
MNSRAKTDFGRPEILGVAFPLFVLLMGGAFACSNDSGPSGSGVSSAHESATGLAGSSGRTSLSGGEPAGARAQAGRRPVAGPRPTQGARLGEQSAAIASLPAHRPAALAASRLRTHRTMPRWQSPSWRAATKLSLWGFTGPRPGPDPLLHWKRTMPGAKWCRYGIAPRRPGNSLYPP